MCLPSCACVSYVTVGNVVCNWSVEGALPHNMQLRKLLERQVAAGTRSMLLNCRLSDQVTAADAANEMVRVFTAVCSDNWTGCCW